jgi:hypothetical protein
MKKSNKLMLGLLVVIIIGLVTVNIIIKNKMDSKIKSNVEIQLNTPDSTITVDSDSIAMEKAISNE